MGKRFSPSGPFNVAMELYVPTKQKVKGSLELTYPDNGILFYGNFRTFGGTESTADGLFTVFATAIVETWYRPEFNTSCRIKICETGEIYRIISPPEDIEFRHQFSSFKIEKVGGTP